MWPFDGRAQRPLSPEVQALLDAIPAEYFVDKMDAERELGQLIGLALPWRWRWIRRVYLRAVQVGGGFDAYNSCGPEDGETCRHGMPLPAWMEPPPPVEPPKPKAKRKRSGRRRR